MPEGIFLTLLVMYPYLLKRKLTWRFVQLPNVVTTSQHCFLYYLSVWKIFSKNSFFITTSRGVPLDCGCKGRYFSTTDQTLSQLFYKIFLTKMLSSWFSRIAYSRQVLQYLRNWQIYVAKHRKTIFMELSKIYKEWRGI